MGSASSKMKLQRKKKRHGHCCYRVGSMKSSESLDEAEIAILAAAPNFYVTQAGTDKPVEGVEHDLQAAKTKFIIPEIVVTPPTPTSTPPPRSVNVAEVLQEIDGEARNWAVRSPSKTSTPSVPPPDQDWRIFR